MHHAILALLFFAVGCCVGSFLNVCAYRIPRGLSLLRPRSRCPRCVAAIRARDNVPLLSWLNLRGECRDCGCRIPLQYLFVELGVGVSFAGVYLARVAIASGDLWEQSGAAPVFVNLLTLWTTISIFVVVTLTVRDRRACSARLAQRPGVGGEEQGLTWGEHARLGEPIVVQFGDLVGTAGIAQPVAGDTTESLLRLDDVDRQTSSAGITRAPRT
jgi:Bacterial Peptidase A24 N-terminal domain